MENLLEILEDINSDVDYSKEDKLIDNGILDSLDILSLVSDIEDEFEVSIKPVDLIPANFNSAEAIFNLIQRLQKED
ncbi:MAG: acyl carrier protein [Clostridium sp.]|nr:acyl carrier protein [Clostridium sp.]